MVRGRSPDFVRDKDVVDLTYLRSHDGRFDSRQHVEGKRGGFPSTRLTLSDQIAGT